MVRRDVIHERNVYGRHEATERSAILSTFAAGVAHELRSPLTAALIAAETAIELKSTLEVSSTLDEILGIIVASINRCESTINDLLRLSRTAPSAKCACDFNAIVQLAVKSIAAKANSLSVRIQLGLTNGLPYVFVNPSQIEFALFILLQNAVQSGATVVHISTTAHGDFVRLCMHDDGCGTNKHRQFRTCDRFDTTRLEADDCDLGRNLLYGIVRDHEGEIVIAEQLDRGTIITVDLPLAIAVERHTNTSQ